MSVFTAAALLFCAQAQGGGAVQLSDDRIATEKAHASAAKNAGLDVAEVLHTIDAEDIWQTAPYCGVNCLYGFLKLNNVAVKYDSLKKEVPTIFKGASLLDLQKTASRYGVETEVFKTTPHEMRKLGFPLIALLGSGTNQNINGHYVVVCGDRGNLIKAIDGTTGNLDSISKPLFVRSFSGYVLAKKGAGVADAKGYDSTDIALLAGCVVNLLAIVAMNVPRPSGWRSSWQPQ